MSSVTTPKSDLFQTVKAVLIMSLFAMIFILIVLIKDNIIGFVCNDVRLTGICSMLAPPPVSAGPDQFVDSRITSACVDTSGLKISVTFAMPLTGDAGIQVFTTGEDVFPSERGMSDSFEISMAIPTSTDQLDIVIPVESMPVGEQIFGNIVTTQDNVISSHVTYFTKVSDCSSNSPSLSVESLAGHDDIPTNFNVTCLPGNRMMVAFEFDEPIMGQFQALVADMTYYLVSVGNQPSILFFAGAHPGKGTSLIKLVSASDQTVVFEESLAPPVCITD